MIKLSWFLHFFFTCLSVCVAESVAGYAPSRCTCLSCSKYSRPLLSQIISFLVAVIRVGLDCHVPCFFPPQLSAVNPLICLPSFTCDAGRPSSTTTTTTCLLSHNNILKTLPGLHLCILGPDTKT